MRFIVDENAAHPGEVSLRLMVRVGSLHEEAGEEGFAHFIEHLAFQGKDGSEIDTFERLGLAAGADTNAHTAPDHTLYRLDLPVADDAAMETAFDFLRRVAGGLTFDAAGVDAERRVILREIDEHPDGTEFYRKSAALLPEVRAARYSPVGTVVSIEAADAGALREFWERHYVPSRMVLVAAGDLIATAMIERIRRHFDPLAARPAPAEPDPGDPLDFMADNPRCIAHDGKEQITMSLAAPHAIDLEPDSMAKRRRAIVRAVALQMLETRISRNFEGAEVAGTPPKSEAVDLVPGIGWIGVSASAAPADASRVLASLVAEWRRVLAHDFHDLEFAEARGKVRHLMRDHFVGRLTRSTADQATRLTDSARTGRILESPEDELNRNLSELTGISRQECEALLRTEWGEPPPRVVLIGAMDESTEASARQAIEEGISAPTPPPRISAETERWVAEPIGPPGRVTRQELDEERGYFEAEFANRVLVRLVPMPSLGGYVRVAVNVGHGKLSAPMERPGLTTVARSLCRWHPIEKWHHLKLDAALADEDVSRDFSVEGNAFQWSGRTDRSQLRLQLELLASLIERPGIAAIDPVWRPGAHVAAWQENRRLTFQSFPYFELDRHLTGHDPRFDFIPDGLMQSDSNQVADWLLPMLATERISVMIAGDFEPKAALDAVAATFGALPERNPWHETGHYPPLPPAEPGAYFLAKDSARKAGSVELAFPLGVAADASDELRFQILEDLLQLRLRKVMRENRGESYAPYASRRAPSTGHPEWLVAHVPCAAGRSPEVAGSLRELVQDFRTKGWSRDEFLRAAKPLSHKYRPLFRNPNAMVAAMLDPRQIPTGPMLDPAALAVMENDVKQLVRKVLDPDAAVELRVDED